MPGTLIQRGSSMLAGNTDENGVACGATGACTAGQPIATTASMLAPKLALSFTISDGVVASASASRGFSPPEMTELCRLQRQQSIADLDSEQLDALEANVKAELEHVRFSVAAFDMDKRNVIGREGQHHRGKVPRIETGG